MWPVAVFDNGNIYVAHVLATPLDGVATNISGRAFSTKALQSSMARHKDIVTHTYRKVVTYKSVIATFPCQQQC